MNAPAYGLNQKFSAKHSTKLNVKQRFLIAVLATLVAVLAGLMMFTQVGVGERIANAASVKQTAAASGTQAAQTAATTTFVSANNANAEAIKAANAEATPGNSFNLFVTSDIHSFFEQTKDIDANSQIIEHGSAAKLATILQQRRGNNSLYVDGGDFSMGTMLQSGYRTHAYELRLLGQLGCDVATFGNHEFDHGPDGLAEMLNSAMASGNKLPQIVQSNVILKDGSNIKKAFDAYGVQPYVIKEVNGVKVGIFGLEGKNSLECAPTNGQDWQDYIEAAKKTVKDMEGKADVIVCLSHSGTNVDGTQGEDIDLLKQVPQINVCVSAHSHFVFEPAQVGDSYIVGPGCYLAYVDQLFMQKNSNGKWELKAHEQIPIAGNIAEDAAVQASLAKFDEQIKAEYTAKFAGGDDITDVICQSPYTFENVDVMAKSNDEFPMQDIIVDSYRHAAAENGVDDIDVAVNGIGTVRTSLIEGPVTVADAFKACSLGMGSDGSAGHPLCAVYVSGKDLKLFVEIESSLGKLKEGIKMAYDGLQITWNDNRIIMDKVIDVKLKRADGSLEDIDDNKQYKICANLYSLKMLGSINSLSKGLIKISLKDKDGNEVTDLYKMALKTKDGQDLKEWVAFKDYLKSLKIVPEKYAGPQGRKVNTNEGGLAIFKTPGLVTMAVCVVTVLLIILILLLVRFVIRRVKRRRARKAAKGASS